MAIATLAGSLPRSFLAEAGRLVSMNELMPDSEGYTEYLHRESERPSVRSSKQRNRKALVLFAALVLLGGMAIFAYFATGRGWSVAATMMDDRVGNMKAYTVVVFSGVGQSPVDDSEERAMLMRQPIVAEPSASQSGESGSVSGNDSVEGEGGGSSDLSHGLLPVDENGEISYNNLSDRIMSIFYRAMAKLQAEDDNGVYVSDVRDLYETSGAKACTVNVSDPAYYATPVVYDLDRKGVGVFSLSSYASRSKVSSISSSLRVKGADVVICVTSRTSMLSTFDGVDIVISTSHSGQADDLDKGDALEVEVPYEGEVGIVLISDNNVAVYKSISEL